MTMKTNNHEVIFAIVNSGFAEDVMEVAREQGVRGGTILSARGVANEEAAAFFGERVLPRWRRETFSFPFQTECTATRIPGMWKPTCWSLSTAITRML